MGDYILEKAKLIKEQIKNLADNATDEAALKSIDLYGKWKSGSDYNVNDRVSVEEGDTVLLYKCIQAHTSQDDWKPDVTPSLWAKVLTSDDGTPLQWEQPDSTNPYMKGDKVIYDGEVYESIVDNNVWEPGVYGWKKASQ